LPSSGRWVSQSISYQEALSLTETKVTSLKDQLRVATETSSGSIATVCCEKRSYIEANISE